MVSDRSGRRWKDLGAGVLQDVVECRLTDPEIDRRVTQSEARQVRLQIGPNSAEDIVLLDDGIEVDGVAAGGPHADGVPGGVHRDAAIFAVDERAQQTLAG